MDASLTFVGSGATLGIALGSSLVVTRGPASREHRLLAFLLVAVSAAMLSITIRHGAPRIPARVALDFIEYVTALAAGPLFLAYVLSRTGEGFRPRPAMLLHLLPAAAAGLQILITGGTALSMRLVMLVQMAYTAFAAAGVVAGRRRGAAAAAMSWPVRLTALMIAVHAAQIVRTLLCDVPALRNVVPFTAIAGLEVIAILAMREAILSSPGFRLPSRERKPADDGAALLATLDRTMRDQRLWSEPNLGLERLARAAGSTSHRVSAALNCGRGGFVEYIAGWRLEAVREALQDPANEIYTIEALAANAGFASRSTFYAAFRKRFGETPSRFRGRCRLQQVSERPASVVP